MVERCTSFGYSKGENLRARCTADEFLLQFIARPTKWRNRDHSFFTFTWLASFSFLSWNFFFHFIALREVWKKISFTVFHCLPRKRLSKGNLSCDSIDTHCGSQMAFTRLKNYLNSQYFTKQMRCDTQTLDNFSQFQFLWYFLVGKICPGFRERMKTDSTMSLRSQARTNEKRWAQ